MTKKLQTSRCSTRYPKVYYCNRPASRSLFAFIFWAYIWVRRGQSCQSILTDFVEHLSKNWMTKNMNVSYANLSKAFDCLPHGLRISNLAAYTCNACNVRHDSCSLLIIYFKSKLGQRVKIADVMNEWLISRKGAPQGSIMGLFYV